jgi:hypothetical protein
MQNHPDKDYLPLIKPRLYRESFEVEETVYYLGHYFDEDPALLSKIREDLLAHEREIKAAFASPLEDTLNRPLPLHMDLNLECPVCHEVDTYRVDKILVAKSGDCFIHGDLPCKKCGVYDDLEITPRAYRRLQALMLKATLCRLNEDNTGLFQFCDLRSQESHVSAAEIFDYYRENLAYEPHNPSYLLGLANVRAFLGRYQAAQPLYETVLTLEPGQPEASLSLADIYKTQQKQSLALKLLDESLRHRSTWNFYRIQGDRSHFLQSFAWFYNSMLPGPSREKISLQSLSSVKKIGRNETCPCGSQKKYKKCCLLEGVS